MVSGQWSVVGRTEDLGSNVSRDQPAGEVSEGLVGGVGVLA